MSKQFALKTWNDLPKAARNTIVIGSIVVLVITTIVVVKNVKEKLGLIQVQVNKDNIRHYTKSELKEFAKKCCTGDDRKTDRPAECNKYDTKLVSCGWAQRAIKYLESRNENTMYLWNPEFLAKRLQEEMNGVAFGQAALLALKYVIGWFPDSGTADDYSTREGLFLTISKLNVDQLRWLHNWWSTNHASGDNLYTWIDGETGVSRDIRNKAMSAMDRAGVGSNIIVLRARVK